MNRLEFAKQQEKIPDNSRMIYLHDSWIRDNTMFIGRHKIGKGNVIGGDGYGFEREENGNLVFIPHRGKVLIGEDVEIKNNTCIDRATAEDGLTVIGAGTKIDNNVHIAHNVKIGKNCLIVAGAVIGGSCEIGDGCFIGINASIKNKVKIGNDCTIGMGAIVTKNVPDNTTIIGVNQILNNKILEK